MIVEGREGTMCDLCGELATRRVINPEESVYDLFRFDITLCNLCLPRVYPFLRVTRLTEECLK